MILTKQEKDFIREHKPILIQLFQKRIEELKENVVLAKPEERNRICDLIIEFKYWLRDIGIFSKETETKKDDFV